MAVTKEMCRRTVLATVGPAQAIIFSNIPFPEMSFRNAMVAEQNMIIILLQPGSDMFRQGQQIIRVIIERRNDGKFEIVFVFFYEFNYNVLKKDNLIF